MDPIADVKESEARRPAVFVHEFYYKYRDQPDGTVKQEEWVMVGKRGEQNPSLTPYRWRDVQRNAPLLAVLKPIYESWKTGEEVPPDGTPLAAWVADAGLVKILKDVNIRTVEAFAELEDHLLIKLNIPSIRLRQNEAKAFLAAKKSTSGVAAENAKLKEEVEMLKESLAEMKALIEQHAIKKEQETVKRGPGRPRKQPTEDAA